jgi:hypothetical protein
VGISRRSSRARHSRRGIPGHKLARAPALTTRTRSGCWSMAPTRSPANADLPLVDRSSRSRPPSSFAVLFNRFRRVMMLLQMEGKSMRSGRQKGDPTPQCTWSRVRCDLTDRSMRRGRACLHQFPLAAATCAAAAAAAVAAPVFMGPTTGCTVSWVMLSGGCGCMPGLVSSTPSVRPSSRASAGLRHGGVSLCFNKFVPLLVPLFLALHFFQPLELPEPSRAPGAF